MVILEINTRICFPIFPFREEDKISLCSQFIMLTTFLGCLRFFSFDSVALKKRPVVANEIVEELPISLTTPLIEAIELRQYGFLISKCM